MCCGSSAWCCAAACQIKAGEIDMYPHAMSALTAKHPLGCPTHQNHRETPVRNLLPSGRHAVPNNPHTRNWSHRVALCLMCHQEMSIEYYGVMIFNVKVVSTNILLVAALPSREHVFHVRFPSEWKASDLNHLFSPFGKTNIRHVTSQRSSERSDGFYFNSVLYRVKINLLSR